MSKSQSSILRIVEDTMVQRHAQHIPAENTTGHSLIGVHGNVQSGEGNIQVNGPIFAGKDPDDLIGKVSTWLSTINYERHHKSAKYERTPGTCTWLFQNERYREWQNTQESGILWLRGDPGTGKTMLTSSVIDHIINELLESDPENERNEVIAYFYCSKNEAARQDPEDIFCSLLKQLCMVPRPVEGSSWSGTLQPALIQEYQTRKRKGVSSSRPDPEECIGIISNLCYLQMRVIIDALDEVEDGIAFEVIELLQKLVRESKARVKVFVSSRNKEDIRRAFELENCPFHYIQLDDTSADIDAFVEDRLRLYMRKKRLINGKPCSEATRRFIYETLRGQAHGMFLWVDLQLKALCEIRHQNIVKKTLSVMPRTLNKTYDSMYKAILDNGEHSHSEIAITVLQWIMGSVKPPSANVLLGVIYWSAPDDGDSSRIIYTFEDIQALCQNFIVLDQELEKVRFIHLSAREYLEKQSAVMAPSRLHSKVCLRSLIHYKVPTSDGNDGNRVLLDILRHSAKSWPKYLRNSDTLGDNEEWLLLNLFLGTHNRPGEAFVRIHRNDIQNRLRGSFSYVYDGRSLCSGSPTPFFAAALCGLERYIKDKCIPEIEDIDMKNCNGQTVLFIAVQEGHLAMIKLLLSAGADPRVTRSNPGQNSLDKALLSRQSGVPALLLSKSSIDIDYALESASSAGDVDMLKFAEAQGVDIKSAIAHAFSKGNLKALTLAAECGHLEFVKNLIRHGAHTNTNIEDNWLDGPLKAAAARCQLNVVKFLLENGADPNARADSTFKKTPLQVAIEARTDGLKIRWDIMDLEKNWRAIVPLTLAEAKRQWDLITFLSDNGVNEGPTFERTPLQVAIEARVNKINIKLDIMSLLIMAGANVNLVGNYYYGAALHIAVWNEECEVAEFLLSHGANINSGSIDIKLEGDYNKHDTPEKYVYDYTPLQVAASKGDLAMVLLLLNAGADVNAQSRRGTALQSAAEAEEWEIASHLLRSGADFDSLKNNGERRRIKKNININTLD